MSEQTDLQGISGRLERGEIDGAQYLELLMRHVATRIGCDRAGLRVFVDGAAGRVLRCVAMYDARAARMVGAPDIVHAADASYLERLRRDGSVVAARGGADATALPALSAYLETSGVEALMDMGFFVNGALFGAFSCEQCSTPSEWTQRQLQALRKIASRASLSLMHVVTAAVDTGPGALWESSTPNRLATMPMPLDAD